MRFFLADAIPELLQIPSPPHPACKPCLPSSVMHPMVVWSREQLWERNCKENNRTYFSSKVPGERGWDEGDPSPLPPDPSDGLMDSPTKFQFAHWCSLADLGGGSGLGKVKVGQDFCTTN